MGRRRAFSTRADGVTAGNVAYEASDADVEALFAAVAPDGLRAMRWATRSVKSLGLSSNRVEECSGLPSTRVEDPAQVTHKDTGEFKGCGYLSFYAPDQADAAMGSLDGAELCGRKIRLDYTT